MEETEGTQANDATLFGGLVEDRPGGDDDARLKAILEAIVYIADEPLSAQQMAAALAQPLDKVKRLLDGLVADYAKPERGLSVREIAGGYKMSTKAEHHEAVRAFVKKLTPPLKLSLAALETLAVIVYKQPVTAPEIMDIRGVQGAGVLKTLLDRKLIAEAGRKKVVGQPILYKTTKEFLVQFGLKDLSELPTIKEFEELGRMEIVEEPPAPEVTPGSVTEPRASASGHSATEPPAPEVTPADPAGSVTEPRASASGHSATEPPAPEVTPADPVGSVTEPRASASGHSATEPPAPEETAPEVDAKPLPHGRGSVTEPRASASGHSATEPPASEETAPEVDAEPLPHGRGSVTEPRASASGHSATEPPAPEVTPADPAGSVTEPRASASGHSTPEPPASEETAPEADVEPLPHGRGSVTKPRASASGHSTPEPPLAEPKPEE